MRHHSKVKKFGREKNQRNALMRSLARSLVENGRITTTLTKAKALRPFAERLVTHAKSGNIASRRLVISRMGGEKETDILFSKIAPKYADRAGGYTRILKLASKRTDGTDMAIIEFV
jgi:large subunit ribosomal protein L17